MAAAKHYPVTPDGRYFVVDERLWRCSDPSLTESRKAELVRALMSARRAVRAAKQSGDGGELRSAREEVDRAKRALGERGSVWWSDGAPDYNRRLVRNTPYGHWFDAARADTFR